MKVVLCSASMVVQERWRQALQNSFLLYQVSSLKELDILLTNTPIDCLLLHRNLADGEVTTKIRDFRPNIKIFLLTDRPEDREGLAFLKRGVVGYGNSYMGKKRLLEAVKTIVSGAVWINQQLMQRLIQETLPAQANDETTRQVPITALVALSKREHQVAQLVARGLTNPAIAEQLEVTPRTVKAHLSTIYNKTGTRNRLNLALLINQGNKKPVTDQTDNR